MDDSLFPEITTVAERREARRNPEPEFTYLSMGAGVQGTAITLLIANEVLPMPDFAIFADTGWEPQKVYEHLDRLERDVMKPIGLPLIRVDSGNIFDDTMNNNTTTRLPLYVRGREGVSKGLTKRQCTSFYKIAPIQRAVREMLGGKSAQVQCKHCSGSGRRVVPWLANYHNDHAEYECSVCRGSGSVSRVGPPPQGKWGRCWIGFSTDEIERIKPGRVPYIVDDYPLIWDGIEMSRDDCLDYIAENGWGESTVKSACIGCPYHRNPEWLLIRENKEEWDQAVALDEALRSDGGRNMPSLDGLAYLHPDRIPLREVKLENRSTGDDEELPSCSPYGCRSGNEIDMPPLWDDVDGALF